MTIYSRRSACVRQLISWVLFCLWSWKHLLEKKRIKRVLLPKTKMLHSSYSRSMDSHRASRGIKMRLYWQYRFRTNRERHLSVVSVGRKGTVGVSTRLSPRIRGFVWLRLNRDFHADTFTVAVDVDQSTAGMAESSFGAVFCHQFKPWDGACPPVIAALMTEQRESAAATAALIWRRQTRTPPGWFPRRSSSTCGRRTCHRVRSEHVGNDCRRAFRSTVGQRWLNASSVVERCRRRGVGTGPRQRRAAAESNIGCPTTVDHTRVCMQPQLERDVLEECPGEIRKQKNRDAIEIFEYAEASNEAVGGLIIKCCSWPFTKLFSQIASLRVEYRRTWDWLWNILIVDLYSYSQWNFKLLRNVSRLLHTVTKSATQVSNSCLGDRLILNNIS